MYVYLEIRDYIVLFSDIRRRIDICEVVIKDILKIIFDRMVCFEDFDRENVKYSLRDLFYYNYVRFVYGFIVLCFILLRFIVMFIVVKRVDVVVDLVVKEVEYLVI